jgi:hypothetical protein
MCSSKLSLKSHIIKIHYRCHLHTVMMTHPHVQYNMHQAGSGFDNGIGPIYTITLFLQQGHGIGSFLSGLFRMVRPFICRGTKDVGRETLLTGGKILTDIAKNNSPDISARDIVSKHVTESTQTCYGATATQIVHYNDWWLTLFV